VPDLERLYNAIERAAETAYGGEDSDLSNERAAAIDAYLGRNTLPAPDGRSQVVDRTVYETIQWMLPSLARIFANGDDVVELPPLGPDDEAGAKQEAQYLNYLVLQKNNWFETFTTAAKDALLTKAGYLYCYKEKRRQIELEKYERQTEVGVSMIMQDKPEVVGIKEYPDPDYEAPPPQPMMQMGPQGPVPVIDPQTGQPAMQPPPPPPMLYDLEIRRVKEDVGYCIEVLPPERVRVSEKHKQVQLLGCPYFEYFDWVTISDLRKDGYKIEDDVESVADDRYPAPEDTARDQFNEHQEDENALDPAMRRVLTRYCWLQHDTDEDGIAELNYAVVVGKKVVFREEQNEIPIGVLCPDPLPHRHIGMCPADNTIDIQQIKTVTLRNGLDNLQISNNPQKFGDPSKVNLDDMLVSRPGGITRTRNGAIFGQDFGVYPIPFVFPQVVEALGYFEQMTEGRTGVNRYFQGTDQNALNKTSGGIQQLSTMAAQRVEQVARHFANGIERLFAVLHALVLKGGHHTESIKLQGNWVEIDPSTWRRRTDFRISVGYAAGNKDAQINRLMLLRANQLQEIQLGLPTTQARNVYETNIELAKAADFSSPQRFVTDPAKVPPPGPPQPDPTIMAAEQMKTQSAEKIKAAELHSQEKIKEGELQVEKYKTDKDAEVKLTIAAHQAQHAKDLEQFKAQHSVGMKQFEGQQTAQLEEHRARLKASPVQEVDGKVQALAEELKRVVVSIQDALATILTAKRTIRRGKDGKAEGVDIVGADGSVLAQQAIQRGADGRIAGSA